jgi:hypothetical protein
MTLTRPKLYYRSKAWTVKSNDEKKLISAEMHFMRRTAGYTLSDHKRNKNYESIAHSTNNRICRKIQKKL